MRKKGFTLIELLVVIAIIAMLLAILMPALNKVKQMAMKVICGTNVKGLGTACMVYAGDYDDQYPVQGGKGPHPWGIDTTDWQDSSMNWEDSNLSNPISVGASLYLLVREADVSPKSFVCPASDEQEYDGRNNNSLDLVELWDFGHRNVGGFGPRNCVSYSYHMPYGDATNFGASPYAASATATASFAVIADKSPLYDHKLEKGGGTPDTYMDFAAWLSAYWNTSASIAKWQILQANSEPHNREGQNVLFGDGHSEWAKTPDVGIKNDNIYTIRGGGGNAEARIRTGFWGATYEINNAISGEHMNSQLGASQDSFLVNDDENRS